MNSVVFNQRFTKENLETFSQWLLDYQETIGYKVSSRGWCYLLESERIINKDQFDKVESVINRCRKLGLLPIDFVAEEPSREFDIVEKVSDETPREWLIGYLEASLNCENWYEVDWHEGEEYYIQLVVEKIDLKTLFTPVCRKYHIPIANSKGWSSMLQRAEYSRRFKEAEQRGMKCVLLYCGDFDPDGLRISDFIYNNLIDLMNVVWDDGLKGYDPNDLIIHRFGLNKNFIEELNLTWIDNLVTGSGKNLASPSHKNHYMPYVQEYLSKHGARKCEANAIMPHPRKARNLVENTIIGYLGEDALKRFQDKHDKIKGTIARYRIDTDLEDVINNAIEKLKG